MNSSASPGTVSKRPARHSSPWDRGEQHERQPAQTRRLDEVTMRGADRIAIDAACRNPCAPSALERIVETDHHRSCRHEGPDQRREQTASNLAAGPAVPIEYPMISGEGRRSREADDSQHGRDGASSWGEEGTSDEDDRMAEGGPVKQDRNGSNHADISSDQGWTGMV